MMTVQFYSTNPLALGALRVKNNHRSGFYADIDTHLKDT